MTRDNLKEQVTGPVIELAAKVKKALEADPDSQMVKTEWGNFYVSKVELTYYGSGASEVVGYLVPDEAEGNTYDFYTPKVWSAEASDE
jgi:hypothetical protein